MMNTVGHSRESGDALEAQYCSLWGANVAATERASHIPNANVAAAERASHIPNAKAAGSSATSDTESLDDFDQRQEQRQHDGPDNDGQKTDH